MESRTLVRYHVWGIEDINYSGYIKCDHVIEQSIFQW